MSFLLCFCLRFAVTWQYALPCALVSKLTRFSICAWKLPLITGNILGLSPSIRALLLPDSMQHGHRVTRKYWCDTKTKAVEL